VKFFYVKKAPPSKRLPEIFIISRGSSFGRRSLSDVEKNFRKPFKRRSLSDLEKISASPLEGGDLVT